MTFQQLNLIEPLLKALKTEGYENPTPIQQQAIPVLLQGKDLLGCAQTGTGKTAAFALPILQLLHNEETQGREKRKIKALILTPTRELAIQIKESFTSYGKFTNLKNLAIYGGVRQHAQTQALRAGVDILIATPGRLLDLINQGHIDLRFIQQFVLDEADRMMDMGFIHDVKRLITKIPVKRQSICFSATMPYEIVQLLASVLTNPVKVEVTPETATAETVQQKIFHVEKKDKRALLIHLLDSSEIGSALVFARTKHGANKVAKELARAGIKSDAIHGNKSQNARQQALDLFKRKRIRVLVATDIAARGIDVDDLSHVINFDLPETAETYVHRIGRTGRAGAAGEAFSFCDIEERAYLRDIHRHIKQEIPISEDHPYRVELPQKAAPQKYNEMQVFGQRATLKKSGSRFGKRKRISL